jgi:hypothetical protein
LGISASYNKPSPPSRRNLSRSRLDALVTNDFREPPDPDPESSVIGTLYEGFPAIADYVVVSPARAAGRVTRELIGRFGSC